MSGVYPKASETLIGWALNGGGATNAIAKCVGVDGGYVFSLNHSTITDFAGAEVTAVEIIPNFVYVDGILNGDDVEFTGLTPPEIFDGVIVFLEWTLPSPGSLLLTYVDQSPDGSLPQMITTDTGIVRWNAAGICVF